MPPSSPNSVQLLSKKHALRWFGTVVKLKHVKHENSAAKFCVSFQEWKEIGREKERELGIYRRGVCVCVCVCVCACMRMCVCSRFNDLDLGIQGHSGSAKANIQCWIMSTTKQATRLFFFFYVIDFENVYMAWQLFVLVAPQAREMYTIWTLLKKKSHLNLMNAGCVRSCMYAYLWVCVRVRVCVCACVRACVRAFACVCMWGIFVVKINHGACIQCVFMLYIHVFKSIWSRWLPIKKHFFRKGT